MARLRPSFARTITRSRPLRRRLSLVAWWLAPGRAVHLGADPNFEVSLAVGLSHQRPLM